MALVENQNLPHTDITYQDSGGKAQYLGEVWRDTLSEGYYESPLDDKSIVRKSSKGRRPSQRGRGTPYQRAYRVLFKACAAAWRLLPVDGKNYCWCNSFTSKDSVFKAKGAYGVICSYYDLWMRCCLKYAIARLPSNPEYIDIKKFKPELPDNGECFPDLTQDPGGSGISYETLEMRLGTSQEITIGGKIEDVCYVWDWGPNYIGNFYSDIGLYIAPDTLPDEWDNVTFSLYRGHIDCDELIDRITVNFITCDDTEMEWDDVNSDDTIVRGGNAFVYITDTANLGGPYEWIVSGVGFSMLHATTVGLGNTLIAGPTACGSAHVSVAGCNGRVVSGYVRCTYGSWVRISSCGPPMTYCNINAIIGQFRYIEVFCYRHQAIYGCCFDPPCSGGPPLYCASGTVCDGVLWRDCMFGTCWRISAWIDQWQC